MTVLLILLDAVLAQMGQLFLKLGIEEIKLVLETLGPEPSTLMQAEIAVQEVFIWVGLVFYGLSVALWLVILSREDLVVAFPLLTIGYVIALFTAKLVLDEDVTIYRIIGTLVICLGIGILLSEDSRKTQGDEGPRSGPNDT